jgi:DnaJ-class molecular chaperone
MFFNKVRSRYQIIAITLKEAYEILELPFEDSSNLEKNYKKLALKYHPDRKGDLETMKKINQARDLILKYNVLKKREYKPSPYRETKQDYNRQWGKVKDGLQTLYDMVRKDGEKDTVLQYINSLILHTERVKLI